jgi:hypothetical protein
MNNGYGFRWVFNKKKRSSAISEIARIRKKRKYLVRNCFIGGKIQAKMDANKIIQTTGMET